MLPLDAESDILQSIGTLIGGPPGSFIFKGPAQGSPIAGNSNVSTRFGRFVGRGATTTPLLPLVHTLDFHGFREIVEVLPVLNTNACHVYNEDLLYLFYGKPCYRPHQDVDPTSLSAFYLISIVFDPKSVGPAHRILPFDSGAFAKGLYGPSLHPRMSLSDFELDRELETAAKVVGTFYGNNKSYFDEVLRDKIDFTRRDLEIEAYLSIVRTPAKTLYDDRRSAIEIQLRRNIDLTRTKVLAIVLPEQLQDDDMTMDFIEAKLGAEALGYACAHARPIEDARAILSETKRFYQEKGFI